MIHALGGDFMHEVSTRDSILKSVCDKLDSRDYIAFYDDIIDRINALFAFCRQYGVGPDEGFEIDDENTTWSDYHTKNKSEKNMVKMYISLKIKLEFDPPSSGPLINALKESISEYEWRITNDR